MKEGTPTTPADQTIYMWFTFYQINHLLFSPLGRGGRGDRMGRYGNTSNDHNFRDMDYRGYGQEEEEEAAAAGGGYDLRDNNKGNRPYRRDDQPGVLCDFPPPGRLQDHPGFAQRGEAAAAAAPVAVPVPCPTRAPDPQTDPAFPRVQRDEDGPGRREEPFRAGPQEQARSQSQSQSQGQGARGFHNNSAPSAHPGPGDGNWGRDVGAPPEEPEYNAAARLREEDMNRMVSWTDCARIVT